MREISAHRRAVVSEAVFPNTAIECERNARTCPFCVRNTVRSELMDALNTMSVRSHYGMDGNVSTGREFTPRNGIRYTIVQLKNEIRAGLHCEADYATHGEQTE